MGERPYFHESWVLYQQGKSVREIAFELDLADVTVEKHLQRGRRYYPHQQLSPFEAEMRKRLSLYDDDERRDWLAKRLREWKGK